ncbi:MAG TPA: MoaD/ThiS family protein [Candidatus Krumholzibacteria bacterium]|nr:MoaD/ThiS family protein [Candidatus Krumholzibacteria bacterium]
MKIELMLFAPVREAAGTARAVVPTHEGATVREIATAFLEQRGVRWDTLPPVRFAVNEALVGDDHIPQDGDRVAVLAPFAGG